MRLFHHLGAGVWSFLASPAAGLVEGARGRAPERFAASIYVGLRGLLSNIVYGFSNATAKMSGAARKVWRLAAPLEQVLHGACTVGVCIAHIHKMHPGYMSCRSARRLILLTHTEMLCSGWICITSGIHQHHHHPCFSSSAYQPWPLWWAQATFAEKEQV